MLKILDIPRCRGQAFRRALLLASPRVAQTVEDTSMLLQHIGTVFGKETAEMVDVLTHLQNVPGSLYKVKLSGRELTDAGESRQ